MGVTYNGYFGPLEKRCNMGACLGKKSCGELNVIAARAERDGDCFNHLGSPSHLGAGEARPALYLPFGRSNTPVER